MTDLAAIRAREADPATVERAQRQVDRFNERMDNAGASALANRAANARSARAKVVLLRQMTDKIGAAAAGLVPCQKGCTHCCHMATLVTLQEAQAIVQATGAKLTMPARFNQALFDVNGARERFNGVPCPFLDAGGCSIYAERPLACRMHYALDVDNLLCEIVPGQQIRVPTLNTLQFDQAIVAALGGPFQVQYADIREFFRPGAGRGK